jgi:hypothetical protein
VQDYTVLAEQKRQAICLKKLDRREINKLINETTILETDAVFSEDMSKRFELTKRFKGEKGKSILIIMMNPTTGNIKETDTTTTLLLNHMCSDIEMNYTTVTIWNLFAEISSKMKPVRDYDNLENMEYLEKLLERNFDKILIGYGNTFIGNKVLLREKVALGKLLEKHKEKVVHIVDEKGIINCAPMHPLFAGKRLNKWVLESYLFPEINIVETKDTIEKEGDNKRMLAIRKMKERVTT